MCTLLPLAWFSKPAWRTLPQDYEGNLNYVKGYRPCRRSVRHLRILLHGPVGAGKSSLINSVNSLFQGRITSLALSDRTSLGSFTKKYTTYKIQKNRNESYNFVFNDIKGLEQSANTESDMETFKCILKGHVRDDYKLDPDNQISEDDDFYNADPTLSDKVHVLVFVIPADKVSLIHPTVRTRMTSIRLAASEEGIPQLVILTKVDQCSNKLKKDINYVYRSTYIEEQVNNASRLLGIPPNCIYPVKNYHNEMTPNDNVNALILFALRHMIHLGEDYLNKQADDDN